MTTKRFTATPEIIQEIINLYKSGLSQKQIGKIVGTAQGHISKIMRSNGIEVGKGKRPLSFKKQTKEERAISIKKNGMRWHVRKNYGLELEKYDELMAQTPNCPICNRPTQHLDHCSKTNKIRSPLCQPCNHGLGLFNHDPTRLEEAAKYLKRWL